MPSDITPVVKELPKEMTLDPSKLTPAESEMYGQILALRTWCGSVYMQVKEWTTRSADLQLSAEQALAMQADNTAQIQSVREDVDLLVSIVVPPEGEEENATN